MHGPKKQGFWTSTKAPHSAPTHPLLVAGARYRVIREFTDYDGHVHPRGEEW